MLESLFALMLAVGSILNAGQTAAHNTTHTLTIHEQGGVGICSATAIGPHKLLTASHCEVDGDAFKVDGKLIVVSKRDRDGADHSILTVDMTFDSYAPVNLDGLKQGDHVYMWGNPGGDPDMYREGYVSKIEDSPMGPLALLDLNGYFGDSGAALFNEKGEVVGVISLVNYDQRGPAMPSFKMMGAFPIRFTSGQVMEQPLSETGR